MHFRLSNTRSPTFDLQESLLLATRPPNLPVLPGTFPFSQCTRHDDKPTYFQRRGTHNIVEYVSSLLDRLILTCGNSFSPRSPPSSLHSRLPLAARSSSSRNVSPQAHPHRQTPQTLRPRHPLRQYSSAQQTESTSPRKRSCRLLLRPPTWSSSTCGMRRCARVGWWG